jgi:hypothetical protein
MIFSIRFPRHHIQLRLFALSEIDLHVYVDDLAGMSLTDVKAFALDPDVQMRVLAARSRMNIDAGLQRILATDPDERVVLALLASVDPGMEACELIIDGPHVLARRDLARRSLVTSLLVKLAQDSDDQARCLAMEQLAARDVTCCYCGAATDLPRPPR